MNDDSTDDIEFGLATIDLVRNELIETNNKEMEEKWKTGEYDKEINDYYESVQTNLWY